MALLQAEAGDKAGARKTLRRAAELAAAVAEDRGKDRALTALACAQARLGDVAAARQTAAGITRKEGKAITQATVARALAGAGQTQDTDSDWWKGNLLRAVGKLQTQRGREKAALEWIGRLDAPLARANALLGVAEGLVQVVPVSGERGRVSAPRTARVRNQDAWFGKRESLGALTRPRSPPHASALASGRLRDPARHLS